MKVSDALMTSSSPSKPCRRKTLLPQRRIAEPSAASSQTWTSLNFTTLEIWRHLQIPRWTSDTSLMFCRVFAGKAELEARLLACRAAATAATFAWSAQFARSNPSEVLISVKSARVSNSKRSRTMQNEIVPLRAFSRTSFLILG
eukprot:s1130_g23.t1